MVAGQGVLVLPSEEDFLQAVSDCNDTWIEAAGRALPACSIVLEQKSGVFKQKLSEYLAGISNEFLQQDGRLRLKLDSSFEAARALFAFIIQRKTAGVNKSMAPAVLRDLASLAKEWQEDSLVDLVDQALADQMRQDTSKSADSDELTWQYSGSHIRERGVQMLLLAHKVGLERLRAEAEVFVAANWAYLSKDTRLTKELEAASLCRIHQLAGSMQAAPLWYAAVLPGGKADSLAVPKATLRPQSGGCVDAMQARLLNLRMPV